MREVHKENQSISFTEGGAQVLQYDLLYPERNLPSLYQQMYLRLMHQALVIEMEFDSVSNTAILVGLATSFDLSCFKLSTLKQLAFTLHEETVIDLEGLKHRSSSRVGDDSHRSWPVARPFWDVWEPPDDQIIRLEFKIKGVMEGDGCIILLILYVGSHT
ncbi:hypothetical protein Peur_018588 [Populus x canadensis]